MATGEETFEHVSCACTPWCQIINNAITVHRQAILLLFVGSGRRKLRKVVESSTNIPFDVERVLDSTTVPVLDSTSILLLK